MSAHLEILLSVDMSDGARTRDNRDHNPVLYQLSYTHHCRPRTHSTEVTRSIRPAR